MRKTLSESMQEGDFVLLDFVGRVKESGEIFDLTLEDVAKKENVYDAKISYKPVTVIVGAGLMLKGLEEAVTGMSVGEKKKLEIPPAKAFGERKAELIRLIPLLTFKERDVDPTPGSYVTINNLNGRVASVDGGRVKVDFNHPLAGKTLEYELELKKKIEDQTEKIKSVTNYFVPADWEKIEVTINGSEAEISFQEKIDVPVKTKSNNAITITKWVGGIEKVKFVDVYSK